MQTLTIKWHFFFLVSSFCVFFFFLMFNGYKVSFWENKEVSRGEWQQQCNNVISQKRKCISRDVWVKACQKTGNVFKWARQKLNYTPKIHLGAKIIFQFKEMNPIKQRQGEGYMVRVRLYENSDVLLYLLMWFTRPSFCLNNKMTCPSI